MKIKIDRNEPSLALFSKRTKYHGSSFIYVDDEFYIQNSAFGSTPEIVSRKLNRLDKKVREDLKKNGVQKYTLQRMSDVDEDYFHFIERGWSYDDRKTDIPENERSI